LLDFFSLQPKFNFHIILEKIFLAIWFGENKKIGSATSKYAQGL
jgi:hypothetical protein